MSERVPVRRWALVDCGFCIRCRDSVGGDPQHPLCRGCLAAATDEYSADEFVTRYCLACGSPAPTTIADPVCPPCRERLYT
jgi:NMD protein affecting ribosome stability and mRNA decay